MWSVQIGSMHLSDFHYLNERQGAQLAQSLERVTAKDEDLFEWNDALIYLTGKKKTYDSAEQAKSALLNFLNGH